MTNPLKQRGYDIAAGLMVLLFFVLLFRLRAHLPVLQDSWYHLGVIRAFFERGPSLVAWWELAPFGRPQLYSPLFHLANVGLLHLTNLSLLDLARLYDVVTFPLVLAAGWLAARLLFGPRAAFVTLLLLALNIGLLFPCSLIMMPGTYALLLWPFVPVLILRKQNLGATVLLSLICYFHLGVAALALVSLLVLALLRREFWRPSLLVAGSAIAVFSPWLLHLHHHRAFLHSGTSNVPIFIPALTVLAALLGLATVIKHPENTAVAVLAMIVASTLFFFTLAERFWIYGGFTLAILGGYGIERGVRRHLGWVLAILLLSGASFTPFLKRFHTRLGLPIPGQSLPGLMPTPLLTLAAWQRADEAAALPPAVPADLSALADWVRTHVPAEGIVLTADPQLGARLFVLTGRRTTTALWSEAYTPELTAKVAAYLRTSPGYLVVRTDDPETTGSPTGAAPVATYGRFAVFQRTE